MSLRGPGIGGSGPVEPIAEAAGLEDSLVPLSSSQSAIERSRLQRLRSEMAKANVDACVLFDPVNVRFATGSRNMQVFMLRNPARYVFISLEGPVILFEFPGAEHLAQNAPLVDEVRAAVTLSFVAAGPRLQEMARRWAREIADLARACGAERIGIDSLKHEGIVELERLGLIACDAQSVVERAKAVKSVEEIAAIRESIKVVEAAVHVLRDSIVPGISEVELWAKLHERMIAGGGEYVETRLLSTGPRTNPWFHEASDRIVEAGDLVALDTDVVGPCGMYTDFSRTFLCGDGKPGDQQRRLYELAFAQIQHNLDLLQPGVSFREVTDRSWQAPEPFMEQRYFCIAHGVGMTGEYPYILHREDYEAYGYDGVLVENMTLCVESYIGAPGMRDGVKLEQQVLLTKSGPEILTEFPLETDFF